jgi:glycosyltransferase involved in cell wall biosynthesis
MRILAVTHRYLPRHVAGTEVYLAGLTAALRARGHTLAVFTGDPAATHPETYEWEGVPVWSVPWRAGQPAGPVATFAAGFANPPVDRQFAQQLAAFRPEVVHVHHLMGLSPRLPALARRHGARVCLTLHDYWFQCSNTWLYRYDDCLCPGPGLGYHCGGCALQRLGRRPRPALMAAAAPIFVARTRALHRVLRQVDRLIAPSQQAARRFAADPAVAARLVVIPHGLAGDAPPASPAPRRGPLRLAYTGPLIRPKGVHVVVEAVTGLAPATVELHLFGDMTPDPAYVDTLRQAASAPGVFFHGRTAHADLMRALSGMDALLVPTLMIETYSVNVDEAFALGLPVVASSHTAAAERIVPEVNGLLAPPGDVAAWRRQIERLSAEAGLLARLRAGVQPPKTAGAHAAEIESLYRDLLRAAS